MIVQQFCSWIFNQKTKTLLRKDIHTSMFISMIFTITKMWKQYNCLSIDQRVYM